MLQILNSYSIKNGRKLLKSFLSESDVQILRNYYVTLVFLVLRWGKNPLL